MSKKPSLIDALQRSAAPGRKRMATVEHIDPTHPSRASKANITGYFSPEVKRQLRILAAEQNRTIQHILAEALNDFFAKNGRPEIAAAD